MIDPEEYFTSIKKKGLLAECPITGGRWHRDQCSIIRKKMAGAITSSEDGKKAQQRVESCCKCWKEYKKGLK